MTETYFDKREGREKPLPDCGCVGLTWDGQTQRCEKRSIWQQLMRAIRSNQNANQGLGFIYDNIDYSDAGGDQFGFDEIGFDPWLYGYFDGGGGGLDFSSLSGDPNSGGSSSASSSGPGWEDLFYFYLDQGYDPFEAATMADEDVAAGYAASVEGSAPLPLPSTPDGPLVVSPMPYTPDLLPWDPWGISDDPGAPGGSIGANVPGYCPGGTYHPYPIGDPRANQCAPFPTDPAARKKAQQQEAARQQQQARTNRGGSAAATQQSCPKGQYKDPATGRCVPIPACPQGMVFSPLAGKCVTKPTSATSAGLAAIASSPWLWILIAAGVVYVTTDSDNRPPVRQTTRRTRS